MIFLVIFRDDLALLFNLAWTDASSLERCSNFFWKSSSAPKIPLHSRETTPLRGCFPPLDEFAGSTTAAVAASSTTISRREGDRGGGGEEEKRGSDGIERKGRRKIIYRVEGSKRKRRRGNRDRDRDQIEGLTDDSSLIGLEKRELFLFVSFDGVPIRKYRHRPDGEKKANRVPSGQGKETDHA